MKRTSISRESGSATNAAGRANDLSTPAQEKSLDEAKTAQDKASSANKEAAQTQSADKTQQATQDSASQQVTGTLAQATGDEVRVDTANQPGMRLKVNDSTKITVDGKDASVSQLREGSQVRASYLVVADQPTAIRIEVKTPKKAGSDTVGLPSSPGSGTSGATPPPR
jgi:hypothetical protein